MVNPQKTICCLNPTCEYPENLDGVRFCSYCGASLTPLRNHYRPMQLLSNVGSFERTYLAEDGDKVDEICIIRQFSLKQQETSSFSQAKQLFEQEAKHREYLGKNPQIPKIFAYFVENDFLYLVEEYINGETLQKWRDRPWNEEEISAFLAKILPVLQFIHDHQGIHRNLKPQNIIYSQKDNNYILNHFGVSESFAATLHPTSTLTRNQGYTAYEQMELGEALPSSDLFSIGAICFYLLTRINPYYLFLSGEGYEWVENWQKHLPTVLSPLLINVLDKLIQNKIQNRYQSAAEVLEVLTPSQGEKKTSTPESLTDKLRNSEKNQPNSEPLRESAPIITLSNSISLKIPSLPTTTNLKTFSFETVKLDSYGNISQRETKQAQCLSFDLGKGITLEMVKIPGGTLMMGSPVTEKDRKDDEQQHQITLSDFYLGKYPITQEQWQSIMGNDPSSFKKGGKYPVEQVSWHECQEFCQKLSEKTGSTFRLPAEAEWEYACRAGTTTPFYFGETLSTDVANYDSNHTYGLGKSSIYRRETTPVGSFPANGFGLYDMHGNVSEWCQDDYQQFTNKVNPQKISALSHSNDALILINNYSRYKVLRGGSWSYYPKFCRCANRNSYPPASRVNFIGFRVALAKT